MQTVKKQLSYPFLTGRGNVLSSDHGAVYEILNNQFESVFTDEDDRDILIFNDFGKCV